MTAGIMCHVPLIPTDSDLRARITEGLVYPSIVEIKTICHHRHGLTLGGAGSSVDLTVGKRDDTSVPERVNSRKI